MINLNEYTLPQLKELRSKIDGAIEQRCKIERANALEKIKAIARENGYELNDLLNAKRVSSRAGKPVPVKYKSKTQPNLTWTGRGRAPKWVQEYLDNGGKLTDLEV